MTNPRDVTGWTFGYFKIMSRSSHPSFLSSLPSDPQPIDTGVARFYLQDRSLILEVNGAQYSSWDLHDPSYLEFEYMQHMTAVVDAWRPRPEPLRSLHLGGAACTLPRAWSHQRPGGTARVVELDASLVRLVRTHLDLPKKPQLAIRVGDATEVVPALRDESFDVVVRDIFQGVRIPPEVATLEATEQYRRVLSATGIYLANVQAFPGSDWPRREWVTLNQVFPEVVFIGSSAVAKGQRQGNLVAVCSKSPLPLEAIAEQLRLLPLPASILPPKITHSWHHSAPLRAVDLAAESAP